MDGTGISVRQSDSTRVVCTVSLELLCRIGPTEDRVLALKKI